MTFADTQANPFKASRPHIAKAHSHKSSSASDQYFSDYASEASSGKTPLTGTQYDTPPSRMSTPIIQQRPFESEMTLPPRPPAVKPAPLNISSSYHGSGARREYMDARRIMNSSPPTPGDDDGPYIRFAIEQLTRDEELTGQGRQGSVESLDYPVDRNIHDEGLGYYRPTLPPSQPPRPPRPPRQSPPGSDTFTKRPVKENILLPIAAPSGSQWADQGFVPIILRVPFLLLLVLTCFLFVAGLTFSNVYASRRHGLFDYDGIGTPRYFVFQFLPQLLGIFVVLWLFAIEAAIYRVLPFLVMASERPHDRVLQDMSILPRNFVLPDLTFFRNREPQLGLVMFAFWLANFTVPLLSCLYQTQWLTTDGRTRWRWTSVQGIGWSLVALYVILTVAVVCCIFRFRKRRSALLWDPVSLADLIPLFQNSNALSNFERSEIADSVPNHIPPKYLRLGYWTLTRRPGIFHAVGEENAPFRRMSLENLAAQAEKNTDGRPSDSFDTDRPRFSYASSFVRNIHSPYIRYRWAPWFLRDSAILAWIIIAIVLLIAFLVVSFVHNAVQHGFLPLLPSETRYGGFSASNFLYSFLPSLLGMVLFLAWQPIDTYFRAIQPFVNLSEATGAGAEHSLLLAYPSHFAVLVTIHALINRDLKVAWASFISLVSLTLPVLAGGIFTAQYFAASSQVRIVATMPAYYALCVFVAIYALSFLAVWPTRKRYLPHSIHSLADLLSFLYASQLLADPAFRGVRSKPDLVARLVLPRKQSADVAMDEIGMKVNGGPAVVTQAAGSAAARYAFGIYMGRDGREHLGIDRLQRPGTREVLVSWKDRRY